MLQFLKDYNGVLQLVSVTLVPIVVVFLTIWYQNRHIRQKAKIDLFTMLMANRGTNPITQQWVNSLNTIDAIFQDNDKVRTAWRTYFESLHATDIKSNNSNTYLIELLSEIAKDLGYKNLKPSQIVDFYSPNQFRNVAQQSDEIQKELLRVLKSSHIYIQPLDNQDQED